MGAVHYSLRLRLNTRFRSRLNPRFLLLFAELVPINLIKQRQSAARILVLHLTTWARCLPTPA